MNILMDDVKAPSLPIAVVHSFVPRVRNSHVLRLPLYVVMALQTLTIMTMRGLPWNDEGLYSFAGHQLWANWTTGKPIINYESFFSGTPALYPVFAAGLDQLGGIQAVRIWSTVAILATTASVYGAANILFERKTASFAALFFAFTGPTLFVGRYATYDATCLALLALGQYVGLRFRGYAGVVAAALLLSLSVAVKYSGAVWLPFVFAVIFLADWRRARHRVAWLRGLLGVTVATAALGVPYLLFASTSLREGIRFTTLQRSAIDHEDSLHLLHQLWRDLGLETIVVVLGFIVMGWVSRRPLLALVLLGGFLVAPLHQMQIHEQTSLHKHAGFGMIFGAILAARGVIWLFNRRHIAWQGLGVIATLVVTLAGIGRADALFHQPVVNDQVASVVHALTSPGAPSYRASAQVLANDSAATFQYYDRYNDVQLGWNLASGDGVENRITNSEYAVIVVRTGPTTTAELQAQADRLVAAARANRAYRLAYDKPAKRYLRNIHWMVWERRAAGPRAARKAARRPARPGPSRPT